MLLLFVLTRKTPFQAYYYLTEAMELRYDDPKNILLKDVRPPIAAYGDWIESQTMEELHAIRLNHNSLHMEALTIRERILGPTFPDLIHPIIFRGAVCADNGRFDRCENLWLHAMQLRQANGLPIQKDLLRFAQLFAQVYHVNYKFSMSNVSVVKKEIMKERKNEWPTVMPLYCLADDRGSAKLP